MALSIPQMARMSQLLEEALALDEAGRRAWLERATQEHPDLAAALREALLPGAAQAAESESADEPAEARCRGWGEHASRERP